MVGATVFYGQRDTVGDLMCGTTVRKGSSAGNPRESHTADLSSAGNPRGSYTGASLSNLAEAQHPSPNSDELPNTS